MTLIPRGSDTNTVVAVIGLLLTVSTVIYTAGRLNAKMEAAMVALTAKDAQIDGEIKDLAASVQTTVAARTAARNAQMDRHDSRLRALEQSQAGQAEALKGIRDILTRIEAQITQMNQAGRAR